MWRPGLLVELAKYCQDIKTAIRISRQNFKISTAKMQFQNLSHVKNCNNNAPNYP